MRQLTAPGASRAKEKVDIATSGESELGGATPTRSAAVSIYNHTGDVVMATYAK